MSAPQDFAQMERRPAGGGGGALVTLAVSALMLLASMAWAF